MWRAGGGKESSTSETHLRPRHDLRGPSPVSEQVPVISCLDAILAPGGLTARFQPILEMRPEVTRLHSMEGLVRGPRGTNVESAVILFEYVRKRLKEPVVDRACVAAVCRAGRRLPGDIAFSVNVHAVTLARDRGFVDHLHDTAAHHSIDPHRITIEIVEHGPAWVRMEHFLARHEGQ